MLPNNRRLGFADLEDGVAPGRFIRTGTTQIGGVDVYREAVINGIEVGCHSGSDD